MFLKKKIEKALGASVLVSDEMTGAIRLWSDVYKNRAPWLDENVKSLNLCAGIANEFSRLVTLEFSSCAEGSKRADVIDECYQKLIREIRRYVEYACALGGIVLKPYVENGKLEIEFVGADKFFPTKFNGRGEVISAAFCEHKKVGEKLYLRIEHHDMTEMGVEITNRAFACGGFFSNISEVPLSRVSEWENLEEYVFLEGVKKPLFSYFKIPFANNIDLYSPLGVSVFSRAVDVICEADRQYSRLLWEFEGGELAIDASVDAVKSAGKDFKMPHLRERLFRGIDIDLAGGDLYSVFAPALRDTSIINGLEHILYRVEDLCGLSRGVFSNVDIGAKTATELKIMRQRTYASVCDIQSSLKEALSLLVDALDVLCDVYDLAPGGDVSLSFDFDDSIISDRQTEFEERCTLLEKGIISDWEMRVWYLGESEEEAKKMQSAECKMQNDGVAGLSLPTE